MKVRVFILLLVQSVAVLWASQQKAPSPASDSSLAELQRQAEEALHRNDPKTALSRIQEGLKRKPDWPEGLWTLGWTLFQTRRYEPARAVFVKLARMDPSRGASWLLLGLCEFEGRNFGMAIEDLQRARALGIPLSLGLVDRLHESLAASLIVTGKFELALQLLAEVARLEKHNDEVLVATGLASLRLPVLPRSATEILESRQLKMVKAIGEALYQGAHHNYAETERIYSNLFRDYPRAPRLHHSYAFFLLTNSDSQRAELEFRAELKVDPESNLARLGLAYMSLQAGEDEEALKLAEEAVKSDPGSATAHYLLGRALLRAKRSEEAVRELETACDLEPSSRKVRFALGQAYRQIGRDEDAKREAEIFEQLTVVENALKVHGRLPESMLPAKPAK